MTRAVLLACALALAAAPTGAVARPVRAVPVMVGGTTELDACGSVGRVRKLRANGFVSVRAAPAVAATELARLRNGHLVWMCDDRPGWYGIVFRTDPAVRQPGDVPPDCGVSTPIARKSAYRGPCRSGWVSAAFVEGIAG